MTVVRFLVSVIVFVFISFLIRFFANSSRLLFSHYGDVFKTALCVSLVLQIWDFDRKAVKSFFMSEIIVIFVGEYEQKISE